MPYPAAIAAVKADAVFSAFADTVSLSQLLERARTRFGLEVEVLDATLQHVYPDSATALSRMIEASPAAIVELDELGRVRLWNRMAERMFGWRSEEVAGRAPPVLPAVRK